MPEDRERRSKERKKKVEKKILLDHVSRVAIAKVVVMVATVAMEPGKSQGRN